MANDQKDKDQSELRGGTQGGVAPAGFPNVGGNSGETNALSPTGGSQRDQGPAAPPGGAPPDNRGTAN